MSSAASSYNNGGRDHICHLYPGPKLLESLTNELQEGHKDCLRVKLVMKRMLIEMLLLIAYRALGIFPK